MWETKEGTLQSIAVEARWVASATYDGEAGLRSPGWGTNE